MDQLDGTSFVKGELDQIDAAKAQARAAFLAAELERIGEDEPVRALADPARDERDDRAELFNEFKAELRAKAKAFWGATL